MRKWLPRAYGIHHNTASTARNGKNPTREFRRINPGLILLKIVCLEVEELMFWCSLVGADRPPKEAMSVTVVCLEQEDLGFGVLSCSWERKVTCAEKIADGRIPLPARSGYIPENRGTVLEKSRRGRVYPAVFRTRQGESGRRSISCVRFTL